MEADQSEEEDRLLEHLMVEDTSIAALTAKQLAD